MNDVTVVATSKVNRVALSRPVMKETTTMKAAIYNEYGGPEVITIAEVDKPAPGPTDVLIKVHASSVTKADHNMRSLDFPERIRGFRLPSRLVFGWSGPKRPILGMEFAGKVVATGAEVTRFGVGDRVFGQSALRAGANAEYMLMDERAGIGFMPRNLAFDQAVAIPFGGATANYYLKELGKIAPGMKVLIHGASGNVGSMGIQFAKHYGATVTGVCSGVNGELLKSLGADHVIDYTTDDFTQNGERYDLIYDTIGVVSFNEAKGSLTDDGIYLGNLMGAADFLMMLWTSIVGGKRIKGGVGPDTPEAMAALRTLAEQDAIRPVIDRRYRLDQIVEAHRYVDSNRKRGSVVITIADEEDGK